MTTDEINTFAGIFSIIISLASIAIATGNHRRSKKAQEILDKLSNER